MSPRRITMSWFALLLATGTTYLIGESGRHSLPTMGLLLALTLVKGRLVVLDFMDLRRVNFFWRALLIGWLLTVAALIAIAYWITPR